MAPTPWLFGVSRPSEKFLIEPSRKFLLTAARLRNGTNRDEPTGRLDWLKRARDRKMTQRAAAEKMGVSERWVGKLLRRMKREGDRVVVVKEAGK